MHAAVLQLAPILGAEKSKVPFYIAGGALVAWALIVSLGLGMRRPDFPGSKAQQRGVIAVTVVLVLLAASGVLAPPGGSTKKPVPSPAPPPPAAPPPPPATTSPAT